MEVYQFSAPNSMYLEQINRLQLFQHYRIYTSDIPNSVPIPEPRDSGLPRYPLLQEVISKKITCSPDDHDEFVVRGNSQSIDMKPTDVIPDILSCIISYGPASWYTVSKKCHEVAISHILQSDHIQKQWENGSILMKASAENNPEMVKLFLHEEWAFPGTIIQMIDCKSVLRDDKL